jgi:hypothetical protein
LFVEMTRYLERLGYLILSFRALARNLYYGAVRFLLSLFVEMTRYHECLGYFIAESITV